MKRAILYARVSRDDRASDGRNLAGQLEMNREYAQEHGYTIVDELAEDDRGASGAEIDLPELNRIRNMAQANAFDVLVVREIDRLSRSLAKQLILEQELQRTGIKIEYAIGGAYPDTPEGRLHKHVRGTLAEYEREKITERTTRARRRKVEDGHVITRSRPPYGYRSATIDGKTTLTIHKPEAHIISMIFDLYTGDSPLSMKAIAKRLSGIPTWNDVHKMTAKRRGYGEWSVSTISRVLSNETYIGRWHYSGIPVAVPAIVDSKTWNVAQKRKQYNLRMSKRNRKYDYLMGGRVRCGSCGMSVCGTSKVTSTKLYLYYRCTTRNEGIAAIRECALTPFRVDQVDTAVWNWIRAFLSDPAALVIGLRSAQAERSKENRPLRDRLEIVDQLLESNRRKLEKVLELYLSDKFPLDVLVARKDALQKTIDGLQRERTELAVRVESQTITTKQIQTIRQFGQRVALGLGKADQSFDARKRIVELLDVRARLSIEDGQKIVYAYCVLGEDELPIAPSSTERTGWQS